MKTIILSTVAALTWGLHLHPKSVRNDLYCLYTRSAKTVVMEGRNKLRQDVMLKDGSMLKPDGVVIRKSGYRFLLEEHECIFTDGTVVGDDATLK